MEKLNNFSKLDSASVMRAAMEFSTPLYIYDEALITRRCRDCLSMPNAYGLTVRYAMKANSNRALLKIIHNTGILIDASSLNEVLRAQNAGIPVSDIILTTQEIPEGERRKELESLMLEGLLYNVCSLRQLFLIGDFAAENKLELAIRVHPGVGTGESATRNTGDNYSCFGVHLSDLETALSFASERGLKFRHIHEHIGSGGDPAVWRSNIDIELGIIERYFPDAETVSFGGGLKEARMPDEKAAELEPLGLYAKQKIENFYKRTGRKLKMEIEPGTYITANSGYAVTKVCDKKSTGQSGFNFVITDGGMEINARPLFYGSQHPVYVISSGGELKFSEFTGIHGNIRRYSAVVSGKCCESGDCQTLDSGGLSVPRAMAEPEPGDYLVIGGAGAYCSSMTPFNYNSHTQIPEILLTTDGSLKLIRKRQTLTQLLENELL